MSFRRTCLLAAACACLIATTGCISDEGARAMGTELGRMLGPPLREIKDSMQRAQDIGYTVEAFHRKQGRWPVDQAELTRFVAESDGLLVLGEYEQMDFTELPDGELSVSYTFHGRAHSATFTMSSTTAEVK